MVDCLQKSTFSDGEAIFAQGDPGLMFYIIKEGNVKVTRTDESGNTKQISTLVAGEYFGEGALLTEDARRANCIAIGEVTVLALSRVDFNALIGPALINTLKKNFETRRDNQTGTRKIKWADLSKVRIIGAGSYGVVTLMRENVTGKTYALKQIRKATVVAMKQQEFVKNERQLLAKLDHPFIVNL